MRAVLIGRLPTTLIDTYNAQDIGNRQMGPGFRWTIMLTPDEQEAYRVDPDAKRRVTRSCRWIRLRTGAKRGASSRRLRGAGWRRPGRFP